ncbi:MAG TPA: efflux RND transporter periplasmic adaptor subunit [Pirellulaceae bacterium]|nr:efflux RND transporter periplasmic adaptor subunit [Pirellulaceae bacterium]
MAKWTSRIGTWSLLALLFVAVGYGGWRWVKPSSSTADSTLVFDVSRRVIIDTVIDRGTIESQKTVQGRCELPGYTNKIIYIVPEGTFVQEGEVVVRFDSAEVDQMINEKSIALNEAQGKLAQAQEDLDIQKNKNETDIATAELELSLAELDLEKYEQGDFIAEKADLERAILEGEAELEKTRDELNNMRSLVKKGFRSPEQLRELELRFNSMQYRVDRDKQKMRVLENFEYKRKMTELSAKAIEAQRKLERARTTASAELRKAESNIQNAEAAVQLLTSEMGTLQETKGLCELKAPQAGTVAYANQPWYDDESRIREGATVYRQQSIFVLPDLTRMQVKLQIHESVVNKIKPDLPASIRVDAFPDIQLKGTVKFVAELAASSFFDAKKYEVLVHIDQFPEGMNLKPGMTAQVEIMAGRYSDVLAVPISAVTEHFGQTYVYRMEGGSFKRQLVEIGRTTHAFVEIVEGIKDQDRVAMDAYQRGLAEFGNLETRDTREPQSPASEAGGEVFSQPTVAGPGGEGGP